MPGDKKAAPGGSSETNIFGEIGDFFFGVIGGVAESIGEMVTAVITSPVTALSAAGLFGAPSPAK